MLCALLAAAPRIAVTVLPQLDTNISTLGQSLSFVSFDLTPRAHGLQAFHDAVAGHTAQGAAAGDVIATFDSVGLLAPRGRFEVEMYLTSMKLLGQVSAR